MLTNEQRQQLEEDLLTLEPRMGLNKQLADLYGISRERVRQLRAKLGLPGLRTVLREDGKRRLLEAILRGDVKVVSGSKVRGLHKALETGEIPPWYCRKTLPGLHAQTHANPGQKSRLKCHMEIAEAWREGRLKTVQSKHVPMHSILETGLVHPAVISRLRSKYGEDCFPYRRARR